MPDTVSDGSSFTCPFCPNKLKLQVPSSSLLGDGKNIGNSSDTLFPPPGGPCNVVPSAPVPCAPVVNNADPGQNPFNIVGLSALGLGCSYMCAKGGFITRDSSGQSSAKHDEGDDKNWFERRWDDVKDVGNFIGDTAEDGWNGLKNTGEALVNDPVQFAKDTGEGIVNEYADSVKTLYNASIFSQDPLNPKPWRSSGNLKDDAIEMVKILDAMSTLFPSPKGPIKGAIKGAAKSGVKQGAKKSIRKANPAKKTFEAAPYHGKVNKGLKSRGPVNGQAALDKSIQVKPTSSRRIAVDKKAGEFVVFDKTSENVYHAHVREWKALHPDMQNALVKSGRVKVVNGTGKILK